SPVLVSMTGTCLGAAGHVHAIGLEHGRHDESGLIDVCFMKSRLIHEQVKWRRRQNGRSAWDQVRVQKAKQIPSKDRPCMASPGIKISPQENPIRGRSAT